MPLLALMLLVVLLAPTRTRQERIAKGVVLAIVLFLVGFVAFYQPH